MGEDSHAESGDSFFNNSNELDTKAKVPPTGPKSAGTSPGSAARARAGPPSAEPDNYDEADIDDIISDDEDIKGHKGEGACGRDGGGATR